MKKKDVRFNESMGYEEASMVKSDMLYLASKHLATSMLYTGKEANGMIIGESLRDLMSFSSALEDWKKTIDTRRVTTDMLWEVCLDIDKKCKSGKVSETITISRFEELVQNMGIPGKENDSGSWDLKMTYRTGRPIAHQPYIMMLARMEFPTADPYNILFRKKEEKDWPFPGDLGASKFYYIIKQVFPDVAKAFDLMEYTLPMRQEAEQNPNFHVAYNYAGRDKMSAAWGKELEHVNSETARGRKARETLMSMTVDGSFNSSITESLGLKAAKADLENVLEGAVENKRDRTLKSLMDGYRSGGLINE